MPPGETTAKLATREISTFPSMITSKLGVSTEDFVQSMFVLTGLSLFIHFCEGVAEEHSPAPVIVVGVADAVVSLALSTKTH